MTTANKRTGILVRPRIYIEGMTTIGPGKVDLLRKIGEMRSISAAARSLGIPYKKAWILVDSLNQSLSRPVVETATGGKGGGGAQLTHLGATLIECYDSLEITLNMKSVTELKALLDALTE
ncbi:MAG TPA: LysR family transcriptional regulator [Rhodocyclaceae bacterium]|jgi:molybdate transport system regulatory protein|nr:LysR family transcriptional regulator [Rhodocyclaceae bacterium]